MPSVHASPYSGRWYPGVRRDLDCLLDDLFRESAQRTGYLYPDGVAYVVPHAGPMYSGSVAAAVYRSLSRQRPERAVLIGFPHRGGLRGCAWTDAESIVTPLGETAIDREFLGRLPFPTIDEDALCDHSVEIQLPFLQWAVPGTRVAPLYAGYMQADERRAAAEALARAWSPGTVVVASSDFTHYGREFGFQPFPPDDRVSARLHELDGECMAAAGSLDAELFIETLERTKATVCGSSPIALLLDTLACIGNDSLTQLTLDYRTSGEMMSDYCHSVSYAALGYYPRGVFDLSPEDGAILIEAARAALRHWRETSERRAEPAQGGSEALDARRNVFVTVRREGELRGCIGNTECTVPLRRAVPELALASALDDPRFSPADPNDGPLDVRISLLTPFRLIRDEQQVVPGRHGVHLEWAGRRSLLLPNVAADRGWGRDELLAALARKGGMPPHAWRIPGAKLSVFEAQVL